MRISRRRFLAGLGAAGAAVGADAFGWEAHRVLVSRHDVLIPGLPPALAGLRVAQVADVHLPGSRLAARNALEHLHSERPQIVVLNGDMTESEAQRNTLLEFAEAGRGTLATVAVLGNWEYRIGLVGDRARAIYREAGVDLLINQARMLNIGGALLALVGLDDLLMGQPNLHDARARVDPGSTEIWLIHEPTFADHALPPTISPPAMLLAGHTHGGQVRVPLIPPVKPTGAGRFLEGWYRDTLAPLYVSRGIGTTGIPARFRCPAELPIFTLRTG
jgi:uncharacterized protein